ncbi:MAG: proline dehydrogenase [bacterium]|nr:proline dehydrogenase [bacterium]
MSLFDRLVITTLPVVPKLIVRRVASRYVAGEELDDAGRVIRELHAEGAVTTVDILGEEVHDRELARSALAEYRRLLEELKSADLEDCYISVKPTQLGLAIDEDFCRENLEALVGEASEAGIFVRLDMEDRTATSGTLRIYRHLRERTELVGTVLQSYMRRTLDDIAELPEGANVRLCKGIYIEPRDTAWKSYETVRHNFVAALEKLFERGAYVAIATHDEYLICAAVALIDRLGLSRDQYELQMLLGVENQVRRILIAEGHKLRVYVPYGKHWYEYSTRRLRENPKIAGHVLRALLRGD